MNTTPYVDYREGGDLIEVYNPKPNTDWVTAMMSIPKRSFVGLHTLWHAPYNNTALEIVLSACRGFDIRPGLLDKLTPDRRAKVIRVQRDTQGKNAALARLDVDSVLPCGDRLFDHQKTAARLMVERRKVILADDMGLGKTRTALVAAKAWNLPVLVVAPASLLINWQREAAAVGVKIAVYSWAKLPDQPDHDVVLIFDEAHYAQTIKSKRTEKAILLAQSINCRACYLLTGTPIPNGRPAGLYPLLVMIDHWIAADKFGYDITFCNARRKSYTVRAKNGKTKTINAWKTDGATNLKKLHSAIKDSLIRRTKAECLDLPPKIRLYRPIEMSGEIEHKYLAELARLKDIYKRNIKADTNASDGGDSQLLTLQLMSAYRQAGSYAKIDTTLELAHELIDQGQKVVLFTAFKGPAETLAKALECKALTGDVLKTEDRQQMIDELQKGDAKALVCTFGAGGVGITLTAAETVILVDRVWTPGGCAQAEDRLHRIGQKNTVTVIWPQVDEMDAQIDNVLITKQDNIDLVLKGKRRRFKVDFGETAQAAGITEKMLADAVCQMVFG